MNYPHRLSIGLLSPIEITVKEALKMMNLASNYSLSMSSRDFTQPSGKDSLFRRWLPSSQLFYNSPDFGVLVICQSLVRYSYHLRDLSDSNEVSQIFNLVHTPCLPRFHMLWELSESNTPKPKLTHLQCVPLPLTV